MNQVDQAKASVQSALEGVNAALLQGIGDEYMRNNLKRFKTILEEMLSAMVSGKLPPPETRNRGMGRVIVDSWPSDSRLGELIIKAEDSYQEI